MRTLLSDLERGQELYYALHQELVFKTFAKRNQLFAEWVAERLGRTGKDKVAYARDLIDHVFGDRDTTRVIGKAYEDLAAHGQHMTVSELRDVLYEKEGLACRVMMESIAAVPAAPVAEKTKAKSVVDFAVDRASISLNAIDSALRHAKDGLQERKQLKFSDLFLSYIPR